MSAHRPLEPLSPLSPNILHTHFNYIPKLGANVNVQSNMAERVQDDHTIESESILSGLTSLENDPTDEFGKLMVQNARDERRLKDALRGNIQPFRKARVQPRVGLTLENLERNNGWDSARWEVADQRQFDRPPSVSSSNSDPAVRPPREWGRKGRVNRDWLKRIKSDEDRPHEQDDTLNQYTPERTPRGTNRADDPVPSIEDSPLSHRGSNRGTPASYQHEATLDRIRDWDLSLDLNEASIIASTPYQPRNTILDDIRQREIESLKEQAVTTNRLDRIREQSPQATRRPKSSSQSLDPNSATTGEEQPAESSSSSEIRSRKRTNFSTSMSKSRFSSEGAEPISNSPIVVYGGSQTNDVPDRDVLADATNIRRPNHRREDSHELLRRLARVSSQTPSPGRVAVARPQTAPAKQSETQTKPDLSSSNIKATDQQDSMKATSNIETVDTTHKSKHEDQAVNQLVKEEIDVDATPMPQNQLPIDAKTPFVNVGGWIDTPGPRAGQQSIKSSRSRSLSPKKGSPAKQPITSNTQSPKKSTEKANQESQKPSLPKSALRSIVEEARGQENEQDRHLALGDDTINSLEDILDPETEELETLDPDNDTLQGLRLPLDAPRSEAERRRQKEILHLHHMSARLRAARTSIRDATRGIRRVENQVGQVEGDGSGRVFVECPCAKNGHQSNPFSVSWVGLRRLFYDQEHSQRWGLTWLGLSLLILIFWAITEHTLCRYYCQPFEAESMHNLPPFGIIPDAPRQPFVTLTILSRPFRWLWKPLLDSVLWTWNMTYSYLFEDGRTQHIVTRTAQHFTTQVFGTTQETFESDLSMNDDEWI